MNGNQPGTGDLGSVSPPWWAYALVAALAGGGGGFFGSQTAPQDRHVPDSFHEVTEKGFEELSRRLGRTEVRMDAQQARC